jgi:hypothetical protein
MNHPSSDEIRKILDKNIRIIERARQFNTKTWKRWFKSGTHKKVCLLYEQLHWDEVYNGPLREEDVTRYVSIDVSIPLLLKLNKSLIDLGSITYKVRTCETWLMCCSHTTFMIEPVFHTNNITEALNEYDRRVTKHLRGPQAKLEFFNKCVTQNRMRHRC